MTANRPLYPVLRWAGGKRNLSKKISNHFPKTYGSYFEPFLGGAAVFLEIQPKVAHLSDSNPRLIEFYKTLAARPLQLIETARLMELTYNSAGTRQQEVFLEHRRLFNSGDLGEVESAATLLLLNRTCYNGLYRENRSGIFNVPHDKSKKRISLVDEQNLLGVSESLREAKIYSGDYESQLASAAKGDLVYLDPPYFPVSKTSRFSDYSSKGFSELDHAQLLETASRLAEKGVFVVVSNSNTKWVRTEYRKHGFELHNLNAKRSLSSKVQSRGNEIEILAVSSI